MNHPTKEQIQWFWEQCGFKEVPTPERQQWLGHSKARWDYPDGTFNYHLPPIDLNNLFKYAVPILQQYFYSQHKSDWSLTEEGKKHFALYDLKDLLKQWIDGLTGDIEKDALALFWAIYKAMEVKE